MPKKITSNYYVLINSDIALEIFSSVDASAKIDPKIGPMQGVHPNPKAIPTTNVNSRFVDLCV